MKKILVFILLLLGGVALFSGAALAGEIVYKKHTVVEFGDDTIEGDLSKPDGQYLEGRKRLRHRNLIKVRESFRQEILQSVQIL
ncbi:adventurous gliding motility protein CglF [Myxococcota bacterium]|nr:adventurous gliding motility protein CglF [Myxococcota bacterium]